VRPAGLAGRLARSLRVRSPKGAKLEWEARRSPTTTGRAGRERTQDTGTATTSRGSSQESVAPVATVAANAGGGGGDGTEKIPGFVAGGGGRKEGRGRASQEPARGKERERLEKGGLELD